LLRAICAKDLTMVRSAIGEVDVAKNFGASYGPTDCIGCGDLLYTGRADGYAETCAN
jgi:hypothetical protein